MRRKSIWHTILAFTLLYAVFAAINVSTSHADSTSYYVNNQPGSNCDNSYSTTTETNPWCDFTPLNSKNFGPGDHIYLARGATWNQELDLNGSGSSDNYATLDAYGTGPAPRILRDNDPSQRAVRMTNPSYWRVSHLEAGNAGVGILVYFTTPMHEGLQFDHLYVHNNRGINASYTQPDQVYFGTGLDFTGSVTYSDPSNQYIVRNVVVDTVEGAHNQDSVAIDWDNLEGVKNPDNSTYHGTRNAMNVLLRNLYLHDDDGANGSLQPSDSGYAQCSDGLRLNSMQDTTIVNSVLDNEGSCQTGTGTAAVILQATTALTFVNDLLLNTPDTGSADQTAIDFEEYSDHDNILDSYFGNNAGSGVEYLTIHDFTPPDYDSNQNADGNTFSNNYAALAFHGYYGQATGTAQNNLSYTRPFGRGFIDPWFGANQYGFTFINNREATSSDDLNYSANAFSSTQGAGNWSSQYNTGSGWSNLGSYETSGFFPAWTDSASATSVGKFDITPGSCVNCSAARTWTAPKSGTVSIRGRVLKASATCGSGVTAQITQNSSVIWGPQSVGAADLNGIASHLDGVPVNQGDVLRFEVSANSPGDSSCNATSWTPSVGFVGSDIGTPNTPTNV